MHAAGRGYLHVATPVPICGRISAEIMDGIAPREFHLPHGISRFIIFVQRVIDA